MIKLAWKIKELSELDDNGRKCYRDVEILTCRIDQNVCSWQDENVPKKLKSIRQTLVKFIKGVTRHQRTAATHILIFMISNEERRTKPYALPVQCIPYVALSDSKVRQLANNIIHEMTDRNMKVAGNGNFT